MTINDLPAVNFGQSQFQDAYFNTFQQSTPFRQLRQIKLEINQIEGALKKQEFSSRRSQLKLRALKAGVQDDLTLIDIEELEWEIAQSNQLIEDAKVRLTGFQLQLEALLKTTPTDYWDQGFEAAEQQYWVNHLTKQLTISKLTGVPNMQAIDMIMALPEQLQDRIMVSAHDNTVKHISKMEEKLKLSAQQQFNTSH